MGSQETESVTAKMSSTTNERYIVEEHRLGEPRHLRVVAIGAGASGLNLVRHVHLHMKNVECVVYEKNADIGGTWLENRYPGCGCDIPSHCYQFTWEISPEWNKFYSPASEILEYFRGVARKYELYQYVKLRYMVVGAAWDENQGRWNIEVKNLETGDVSQDWCHVLINGSGVLNNWKWPNIQGLQSFKGDLIHTAAWKDVDLKGKTVAVLGCGSSGVQIVPAILPEVKELITFIRTPIWITAGFAQAKAGPNGANFSYSEEQKQKWRDDNDSFTDYRKDIEAELNVRFKFAIKDSLEQKQARQFSTNEMKTKLAKKPELAKHMIPDFAVGCRRPTPGNGYLESLTSEKVRVVTDEIQEIVPEGIKLKTGEVFEVDVFICATGFDISFCPRFSMVGRNGINLAEQWSSKPTAYLSIAAANMPNYFMFLGPNAPVGHGSLLPIIEHSTKYMIRMLYKMQTENIKSFVPKPAAIDDFVEHTEEYLKRTAWSTHCRSWFKNGKIDGPIVALHPGSRIHWFHMMASPRFEDWDWQTTSRNRFAYLGDGFSTLENPGKDLTWYLDNPEEGYERLWY